MNLNNEAAAVKATANASADAAEAACAAMSKVTMRCDYEEGVRSGCEGKGYWGHQDDYDGIYTCEDCGGTGRVLIDTAAILARLKAADELEAEVANYIGPAPYLPALEAALAAYREAKGATT